MLRPRLRPVLCCPRWTSPREPISGSSVAPRAGSSGKTPSATCSRVTGSEPGLAAIGTGSHTDAIPHAGPYDGTVGVLGGLEAIRALQRAGFQPRRSIELLMFTSEEPTRFGIGCLGSRLLSGSLNPGRAKTLTDSDVQSLDQVRIAAGFTGELDDVLLSRGYYEAFLELHVEQGPILEARNIPVGVVTAIAAPASLRIWLEGRGTCRHRAHAPAS